ncbi:MAG: hypothetical protein DMF51_07015 [Acidobacteria bacterium]|nr:MAG: hypothetical protein DMF51_07015 [Acidobacteriota bacterium]
MLKGMGTTKTVFDFDPLGALAGGAGGAILWARQGRIYVDRGDLVGALQSYQRSLEADMDCVEAWIGLSEVFTKMQDRRRAENCLDVARRIRSISARHATA